MCDLLLVRDLMPFFVHGTSVGNLHTGVQTSPHAIANLTYIRAKRGINKMRGNKTVCLGKTSKPALHDLIARNLKKTYCMC